MPELEPTSNYEPEIGTKVGAIALGASLAAGEVAGYLLGFKPVSLEQLGLDLGAMGSGLCIANILDSCFGHGRR